MVRQPATVRVRRQPAALHAEAERVIAPVRGQLVLVVIFGADLLGTEVDAVVLRVVIDLPGLGRDAAALKKIFHCDELVQQLVDRGQRAGNTRLVDVMDEDDRAVVGPADDVVADSVRIAVFPVQRVDRPVDERHGDIGTDGLVRVAVGRADVGRVVAARGGDQLLHGGDLLADLRGGERVEIGVIISMVRKLVPLVHNALQRLRVVRGAVARDEECRLHAARGQLVEQSRRVWPWAVVKRDGQQLRPAIQTFCLTNWGETGQNRRQKQQNGQNSLPFPHGKHLDSSTHHSRICKI